MQLSQGTSASASGGNLNTFVPALLDNSRINQILLVSNFLNFAYFKTNWTLWFIESRRSLSVIEMIRSPVFLGLAASPEKKLSKRVRSSFGFGRSHWSSNSHSNRGVTGAVSDAIFSHPAGNPSIRTVAV